MGFFSDFFKGKPKGDLPKIDVRKRFELLNRTGQGSMSKVSRARDKSLGKTVCLKLLDKQKTHTFESRFLGLNKPREGAICEQLRHPNIVQTFEYGLSTEGEYYLVMELIEGVGLNFQIETRSDLLVGNRINYLKQIARRWNTCTARGFCIATFVHATSWSRTMASSS